MTEAPLPPHVFISYSWSSPQHQEMVKGIADRLIGAGVNVILDVYDLKEGQDKNAFMEQMVTRPEVSHVLIIGDKAYAEKADARRRGVGTESQIISQEVYDKVNQTKFIPVACELNEHGEPYLPTFLKSRIFIDFSSEEARNSNWERLVRFLYGKPLHQKPSLGKQPAFLLESSVPASPIFSKYSSLRQALLEKEYFDDLSKGIPRSLHLVC